MAWDFETDPEFQRELDWATEFVRDEVEPLDLVLNDPYDKSDAVATSIIRPLQQRVKDRQLWACHLGPELGGPGYGQVEAGTSQRDPGSLPLGSQHFRLPGTRFG